MMLEIAKEYNQLEGNIVKMPRRKVSDVSIRREIAEEEENRVSELFEHVGKLDHRDAFEVLIDTGLRMSELWRVDAKAVNFESGHIHIWKSKNGTARSVPMSVRVMERMRDRILNYPTGPLWPMGSKDWFRNGWDLIRAIMGLSEDRGFTGHSCRHTACSRLVRGGMPLPDVMRWMGHKDMRVTMRYAHLAPGQLMQGIDAMKRAKEMERARVARMAGMTEYRGGSVPLPAPLVVVEEGEAHTETPDIIIRRAKPMPTPPDASEDGFAIAPPPDVIVQRGDPEMPLQ
ncbi:hypothetical protein KL86DPRO_60098 [uncultured delta proteobacterium]|uniref:Tyr recombinase domain-containing protein n=1 Tax=uncultured delta proteobacterium TaxID=34034 RepID=A0A212KF74_9DELT|nr:hypothetical protein KL86DPRO_60098 [uncultured delta proteobacterium]